MKRLLLGTLMVFLPLAMLAQTQHIKFKQSGEFASFSSSPDPLSQISLTVSRNFSTTAGASASLNYSAFTVTADFTSETFVQIVGEIPASAFTGQNTKHLVLDFDTSQLDPSTSFTQNCTVDLNLLIQVCGPAPTGLIHLEFEENGLQRTRVLDFNEEIINGSTTTRIHQKSDNGSANVQGSLFNVPVSSASATVGMNKESSLEVIKN
jgi:hypothetical protein